MTTRGPEGETQTELTTTAQDTLATERNQGAVTLTFLNEEFDRARERLAALQSQPDADSEQISKARGLAAV